MRKFRLFVVEPILTTTLLTALLTAVGCPSVTGVFGL
jgi:hypothetical protein